MYRVVIGGMKSTSCKRMLATLPKSAYLPQSVVQERVESTVGKIKGVPPSIGFNNHFVHDLGLDSLNRRELILLLGKEFNVPIESVADQILSVNDAVEYLSTHSKARYV
jgi:acyl carrier protein